MAFLAQSQFDGSKKTMGGREGFSEETEDPKPMHLLRARPFGTEVSESESEWDGQTCCSVSTSIHGKAGSVSRFKSEGKSNVSTSKVMSTNVSASVGDHTLVRARRKL